VANASLLLAQVPPVVGLKLIVLPTHTDAGPVAEILARVTIDEVTEHPGFKTTTE